MMKIEEYADQQLEFAKDCVKRAIVELDPNPAEPVSAAFLKALDSIDAARKSLKERMPE